MRLTASHLGYGSQPATTLLLSGSDHPNALVTAQLDTGEPLPVTISAIQEPPGWTCGPWRVITVDTSGLIGQTATIEVKVLDQTTVLAAATCRIGPDLIQEQTISDVLYYFKAVRSSGEIDRKDSHALFWNDDLTRDDGPNGDVHEVDAHGGWLDASGDHSKFLSHLTYTRMMSPQQTPLCAWAMMAADEVLERTHPTMWPYLHARLRDEGLFGADFLVRFQHPSGYFYTSIFDALTKRLDERVITAPLQDCVRTTRYQAAYRHGGGMAIAALARAARQDDHGDFTPAVYWRAAVTGLTHLNQHNTEYSFDNTESIIDDYCALMAACELEATWRHRGEAVTGGTAQPDGAVRSQATQPNHDGDAEWVQAAGDISILSPTISGVDREPGTDAETPDPDLWRRTATARVCSLIKRYRPGTADHVCTPGPSDTPDHPDTPGYPAATDHSKVATAAPPITPTPTPDPSDTSDHPGTPNHPGYLVGDAAGRPYFHAAESGLPIIALVRYHEVFADLDPKGANQAAELAIQLGRDWLTRTNSVPNPFDYPRALVQPLDGEPRESFFFPHANETGYWWQGENANICSLSVAANLVADLDTCPPELAAQLHEFASDQLSWILGRNPFDVCMLQGRGQGNREYHSHYPNVSGGILNGITAGYTDENDIAFLPDDPGAENDSWRWAEQWIPHAGWFLLAASTAQ